MPRVDDSPTAVKRHVAEMAVFWLPGRVRGKGLVRSLAPIVCLSPPFLPAFYQTAVPGIDYTTPFPYPN